MPAILLPAHAHDACRSNREAIEVWIMNTGTGGRMLIGYRYNPAERERDRNRIQG